GPGTIGAVWLDIDLDAFCNRFDGDSSRRDIAPTETEAQEVTTRIDEFLGRLRAATWKEQVRAVSVAASPGFFPSEYWNTAVPQWLDGFRKIVCSVGDPP